MSSGKEKDKYNVVADDSEYAVESNSDEIIYEEYIDADQILEGYTEDGEVIYYTEDGVYEEIILGDDSDIAYEEVISEDENLEKTEDVIFIEQEKESEKVILGDGSDDVNQNKINESSKKIDNNSSEKKDINKKEKNKDSKKEKNSKNISKDKKHNEKKLDSDEKDVISDSDKFIDDKNNSELNSNSLNNNVNNTNTVDKNDNNQNAQQNAVDNSNVNNTNTVAKNDNNQNVQQNAVDNSNVNNTNTVAKNDNNQNVQQNTVDNSNVNNKNTVNKNDNNQIAQQNTVDNSNVNNTNAVNKNDNNQNAQQNAVDNSNVNNTNTVAKNDNNQNVQQNTVDNSNVNNKNTVNNNDNNQNVQNTVDNSNVNNTNTVNNNDNNQNVQQNTVDNSNVNNTSTVAKNDNNQNAQQNAVDTNVNNTNTVNKNDNNNVNNNQNVQQNTVVDSNNNSSKSVFTQEEKESLVFDENTRMANVNGQVGGTFSKNVPVVEINLENSKSSLQANNNSFNNNMYANNQGVIPGQQMSNMAYQMQGQIQNGMMNRGQMTYQNQMMPMQNSMPTMQPMNTYMNINQGGVAQPQIINSQPVPYQTPVMTQPYQSAIPVATSGVVPPSNMNYQANPQQMMQPVNSQMMYQPNSGVYNVTGVQPMVQPVYPNNAMPQVPRVNPYQAMKPAAQPQNNKSKNSTDKSIYKKNHGFLKFIFLLIFLAIVGLAVYILFFRESNYNGKANLNSLYDPLKPIPVYDGKLVGYVDYNGKTVIEPSFDTGSDFYGEFAIVSKDEKYKIINKAGDQIVQSSSERIPFYDNYYDVWIINNCLYGNEMNLLFSNIKDVSNGFYSYVDSTKGEVGIVDNTGKILYSSPGTTISFETMETFFNDSYALVKVEGTDDVIISGVTGEVIYKSIGINIKNNNIFSVNFNGISKFVYVFDGKVVKEFDNVSDVNMFNFNKKILQVTNLDGSNYYYDTIGNSELTAAEAGDLVFAEEYYGYQIVKIDSDTSVKYNLMKNGESVLDSTYDSISFLEPALHEFVKIRTLKEFVILTSGETVLLYDLTFKKVVIELQNVDISYGGTFVLFTAKKDTSNKEDVVYNLLTNLQTKFTSGEKEYTMGSNYIIAVDKNNNASYYNIKVKNIYETSIVLQ